jgi:hypothetical protein
MKKEQFEHREDYFQGETTLLKMTSRVEAPKNRVNSKSRNKNSRMRQSL